MRRLIPLLLIVQVMLHAAPLPGQTSSSQAVELDFENRKAVTSPDGKWYLTVQEDDTELGLVLQASGGADSRRLMYLQRRACAVLWREDSKVFAVLDYRFANHYFVLVGLPGGHPSPPLIDLTPLLEGSLRQSLAGRWDLDKICWKAFRWLHDGMLLVGVEAEGFKKIIPPPKWEPTKDIHRGYVVDIATRRIVQYVSQDTMRTKYGIDLEHQIW